MALRDCVLLAMPERREEGEGEEGEDERTLGVDVKGLLSCGRGLYAEWRALKPCSASTKSVLPTVLGLLEMYRKVVPWGCCVGGRHDALGQQSGEQSVDVEAVLDVLEQLKWWAPLRAVPDVECRGLSTLTMTVDKPGMMGGVREPILSLVAPLRAACWEPKMDVRLKKTDSWISGAAFLEPTAQDWDAHWTTVQGGVAGPRMN